MGKRDDGRKTRLKGQDGKTNDKEKREYDLENHDFIGVGEPNNAYLRKEDQDDLEQKALRLIYGGKEDICGDKTLEDYLALPEGTRVELIDGVFYDMASPTYIHAAIGDGIMYALKSFVKANKGSCRPFSAPLDVQLDCDDKTMVQPDVLIVCDPQKLIYPRIVGAPDLIVEVVSPSNFKMDVVKKRFKYEKAGVREYWMVFPEEKRIRVCHFEKGEEKEYTFADKVPVGIWDGRCEIDFAEIYEWMKPLYEAMEEAKEN